MWGKTLQNQSLFDMLLQIMPNLRDHGIKNIHDIRKKMKTDAKSARKLMDIWDDEDNKVSAKKFRKPLTINTTELNSMEKDGLIKTQGDQIEITQKGSFVIKQMILGDDRSIFDDHEKSLDYVTACGNLLSNRKITKLSSRYDSAGTPANWYQVYKNSVNE